MPGPIMPKTAAGAASIFGKRSRKKIRNTQEPKRGSGPFFISEKKPEIKIVSTLKKCEKLWHEFSPKRTLSDTWEFRLAFQKAYKFKPYFMVLKKAAQNVALLPLCYDQEDKRYIWFGTNWQEEVDFFADSPESVKILLEASPKPLILDALSPSAIALDKKIEGLGEDDPKYILDLPGFFHHEDYLKGIKKNDRRNMRKDRNRIEKMRPKIEINKFSDLKHLIKLSEERFAKKGEDTDWEDPRRVRAFKNVIRLSGKSYQARMISIRVGKKVAGVDLVCLYNGCYFAVKCGYDCARFSGIGNFMNLFEIDDAIKLGMHRVDFLQSSYQWKNKFFTSLPLFKIHKI